MWPDNSNCLCRYTFACAFVWLSITEMSGYSALCCVHIPLVFLLHRVGISLYPCVTVLKTIFWSFTVIYFLCSFLLPIFPPPPELFFFIPPLLISHSDILFHTSLRTCNMPVANIYLICYLLGLEPLWPLIPGDFNMMHTQSEDSLVTGGHRCSWQCSVYAVAEYEPINNSWSQVI